MCGRVYCFISYLCLKLFAIYCFRYCTPEVVKMQGGPYKDGLQQILKEDAKRLKLRVAQEGR